MNKKLLVSILVAAFGLAAIAGAVLRDKEPIAKVASMAELKIDNLSCGSCVQTIKQALASVDGIGTVDVSVTNARGQVTYDSSRISAERIAQIVTAAGYPARVRQDLDAEQYRNLQAESEQMSSRYVARIGQRFLARDDFDQLVKLRSGSDLAGSPAPYASRQFQTQVWREIREREILLAAADKNRIVVQPAEVELQIKRMKEATGDFDRAVTARFGSYERFVEQVRDNMIINRNIEQNVIAGLKTEREKQLRFSAWYDQLQQETDIVIFDPRIKQAEAAGVAACGGSCGS